MNKSRNLGLILTTQITSLGLFFADHHLQEGYNLHTFPRKMKGNTKLKPAVLLTFLFLGNETVM